MFILNERHVNNTTSLVRKDAPVVVAEMSTQTEPEVIWDGTDIPDYDGNLLMSIGTCTLSTNIISIRHVPPVEHVSLPTVAHF